MIPRTLRWGLVILACAATACGDQILTAPAVASSAAASFDRTSEVVGLLKRVEPLSSSLTASGVIGPRGGHLKIGEAGFRIDFAPGAVKSPTRITVTAVRGRNVAYRFEPHGIAFAAPVTIRQSLRNTTAWKKQELAARLQGSYFDRLLVDPTETLARSFERRPGRLRDAGRMLEFGIEHFSGYMVSTGKAGVEMDVEIDITSR